MPSAGRQVRWAADTRGRARACPDLSGGRTTPRDIASVPMSSPYATVDQAARVLLVDRATIIRWIKRGLLPAVRLPGGRYRIARDDLRLALRPGRRDDGRA